MQHNRHHMQKTDMPHFPTHNPLKKELNLENIYQKLPIGIELYDEEGNLIDLNETDEQLFAIKRTDIIGINLFENPNFPTDQICRLKKGEEVAFDCKYAFDKIKTNRYYHIDPRQENTILYLSIKCLPLKDKDENIYGYIIMFSDETEKYKKIEETNELFNKLKTVIGDGDSLMWEYDIKEDKMHIDLELRDPAKPSKLKECSLTSRKDFYQLVHPDDRQRVLTEAFDKLVKGEIKGYTAQYRRLFRNEYIWVKAFVQPYKYDENGKPLKILYYLTDITNEINIREKLRAAEQERHQKNIELAKAQESNKLKSMFLANMSHEIRTPLNAIVGFSSLLADMQEEDMDERHFYVDIINKNSDLLLQLINDILDFSKIEAGTFDIHLKKFDFKEICEEIYAVHTLKIPDHVRFSFNRDLPSVKLNSDPKRLTQVISNFLTNAIKFTSYGEIKLDYRLEEDKIYVSVTDTGIGISEEACKNIFDRFVKLNAHKQGTGLGLSISKSIIEKLGGNIGVCSTLGKGSTFWFTLPLATNGVSDTR